MPRSRSDAAGAPTFVELRRVRAWLVAGVSLRAALLGLCAAAAGILLLALVDAIWRGGLSVAARTVGLGAVGIAAAGLTAASLALNRRALRLSSVALWIEERVPELRFALVSELESLGRLRLVRSEAAHAWRGLARNRVVRALVAPLTALLVLIAVLAALPSGARVRAAAPRRGDLLERTPLGAGTLNRLEQIEVEVIAPAYAHRDPERLDDPATIRALPGSRVMVVGRGSATGIAAHLRRGAPLTRIVATAKATGRWQLSIPTADSAMVVELDDGAQVRLLDVEPVMDAAPTVTLLAPARDSVLAAPRGRIELEARAADDMGLAEVHFEIVISAGEGENFTFRTLVRGAQRPGGRSQAMRASLPLDSLGLHPGDLLHVRALASDGNTVTGPGVGSSDTRVMRVARPGADDSVAITPAAPADTNQSALSERMLIELTQALARRASTLDRPALLRESHGIAVDQQRLRRAVGDVVFARLGGQPSSEDEEQNGAAAAGTGAARPARGDSIRDLLARADRATAQSIQTLDFDGGESPVVAVNAPLLEAYNAMWDAGTSLEQGELDAALPHMRAALAAIERSRQAERVYLRGRAPDLVVDLSRARLQGKERGASSVRLPHAPVDSARARLASRYVRILALPAADGAAIVDSLLLLRVDALGTDSSFAAALGDAADALRRGRAERATAALLRARRAIIGERMIARPIAPWGGGVLP